MCVCVCVCVCVSVCVCVCVVQYNLFNLPQLGMSLLWWISGVGGSTKFALSTCIVVYFSN